MPVPALTAAPLSCVVLLAVLLTTALLLSLICTVNWSFAPSRPLPASCLFTVSSGLISMTSTPVISGSLPVNIVESTVAVMNCRVLLALVAVKVKVLTTQGFLNSSGSAAMPHTAVGT